MAAAADAGSQAIVQGKVTQNGSAVLTGYARLLNSGGDFVAEVPLVAGALEAGALATGTMTTTPARTAPKAARRARAVECNGGREDEPTRARYAGA